MEQFKPLINKFVQYYYNQLDNSAGGNFHIALDDGNLSDSDIWFCQQEAEKNNDSFGIFLGQLLRSFTEDERNELYLKDWWGMQ